MCAWRETCAHTVWFQMRFRTQANLVFFALVVAIAMNAQTAPRQRQQPHGNAASTTPAASPQPSLVTPAEAKSASSLLDQPAKPAQVGLDSGKLSVKADNSALSEILQDISAKTGMSVNGLSGDLRIFGNYGPAAPREVLSALLDGAGYNVLMVGALNNGAPRELSLTPRTATGTSASSNAPTPRMRQEIANSNSDDEDDTPLEQQQDTPIPPRPEANLPEPTPAPGQQPPGDQGQPGQVRTPQQMLQELQQMRQQQLQQQQANPQ